jgi:hypothetical protein
VSKFYVNTRGEYYHGDRIAGDREATQEELLARAQVGRRSLAAAQIRALEFEQLLPRAVREFILGYMEERATAEQLALLPAYVKLKTFDNTISGLRAIVRGDA